MAMIVNINRFHLQLHLHLTVTTWIRSCFEWFTLHHESPGCKHCMFYYINSLKQTAQKHVENLIIFSVKSECMWCGVECKENSQLMQFGLFVRSGVPLFSPEMFELLFRISIDIQLFLFVLCMLFIFKVLDYKWASGHSACTQFLGMCVCLWLKFQCATTIVANFVAKACFSIDGSFTEKQCIVYLITSAVTMKLVQPFEVLCQQKLGNLAFSTVFANIKLPPPSSSSFHT